MSLPPERKRLKQAIINTSATVRKKFKAFKRSKNATAVHLEQVYKPLVEPLKEITQKSTDEIKREVKKNSHRLSDVFPLLPKQSSTPTKQEVPTVRKEVSFLPTETIGEIVTSDTESDSVPTTSTLAQSFDTLLENEDVQEYMQGFHPLPRQYLEGYIRDTNDDYDTQYGVKIDALRDQWTIGNSHISIPAGEADFTINKRKYKGTPGLYELLFKKQPLGYTPDDLQQYAEILEQTSAHKVSYDPAKQIAGNKGVKYKKVIQPLFQPRTGRGLSKQVTDKPVEYVYWNTVSELVNRLRLLYASKKAGHTGLDNEILSIIEELREEGIIA